MKNVHKVLSVKHWTESLFSFKIERPKDFKFKSGEFVMIGLPDINKKQILRAYSICSPNWADEWQLDWAYTATPSNPMTAFNIVTSPWDEEVDLVMTGLDDGKIEACIVDDNSDEYFDVEERFKGEDSFTGPIADIGSFDFDGANGNELWIADGDGIHGLFFSSLI